MSSNNKTASFPLLGILGLIFITLKLIGYIAWSWLWVLSPFWIPFGVVVFALLLLGVGALVVNWK